MTAISADTGERGSGAYILLERVGQGGFGTVYRALDIERDREVAIKRFRLATLYSREQRENIIASIKNELDATAELSHPGIARTIACGREADGEYYVVQEFVKGPEPARPHGRPAHRSGLGACGGARRFAGA